MQLIIQDDAGREVYALRIKARTRLWRDIISILIEHYRRTTRTYWRGLEAWEKDFEPALDAAVRENSLNHPKKLKKHKGLVVTEGEVDYPVTERGNVFHQPMNLGSIAHEKDI